MSRSACHHAVEESCSHRAATTSSVLVTLDSKIESISAQTAAKRASQEEHDAALQAVLKEVTDRKDKGGHRKGTIDRDSMLMDVDDILEQAKGKNRKSVTFLCLLFLTFG